MGRQRTGSQRAGDKYWYLQWIFQFHHYYNFQGIEEPVTGGEVRDKTEQYRGLGSKPDIYDEYRKQMSTQMAKRLHKF
jgi:hypothetical protein